MRENLVWRAFLPVILGGLIGGAAKNRPISPLAPLVEEISFWVVIACAMAAGAWFLLAMWRVRRR